MNIFDPYLIIVQDCISVIGVLIIVFGAARAVYHLLVNTFHKKFETSYIRLQLGESIILGLEFMVGADIVGTVREPDYHDLGILAILVVIRTVLSFFLNQELSELSPQERSKVDERH